MSRRAPPSVDSRAFRWPLARLESLRAHAVDRAAAQVAGLQRDRRVREQDLARAEVRHEAEVVALSARCAEAIDPALQRHHLGYLASSMAGLAQLRIRLQAVDAQLAAARRTLCTQECQLASVRKLRESAQKAFSLQEAGRQSRIADLAFLARHAADAMRRQRGAQVAP